MLVGVPREIKAHEARVGLTPAGALALVRAGHGVLIEVGAGVGSGLPDAEYERAGAVLVRSAEELYDRAELIVKVKEPQPEEVRLLTPRHVLFGYLHLAAERELTEGLLASGATALAYETLRGRVGGLPLLAPMSAIAGRLSVQVGAHHLERPRGGSGVLLGGVPGVLPGRVLILGGGIVGSHAARMAAGLGADVIVCDVDAARLERLSLELPPNVRGLLAEPSNIEAQLPSSDLVIGAVLVPGARAPHLVSRAQLGLLRPGSVIVDVCIDQGGCFETSRPTTHDAPTYVEEGVVHYMVTNMPGAVPRTSTQALTGATLPYVLELAELGLEGFLQRTPGHSGALALAAGRVLDPAVAATFPDLPTQLPTYRGAATTPA